jgi:large conductance mechanosensitive channel
MLKDFREFVMRGNVMDLAIAVIIGGAFGKIVSSLVSDVIMPPIGLLLNGVNFADLFISLNGRAYATLADAQAAGAPTLNYGNFFNEVIDFLVIALVVFLVVRAVNRLYRREPAPPPTPTMKDCPYCFTAISLKATRCPNCTSQL